MRQCQESISLKEIECILNNYLCKKDVYQFIYNLRTSRVIEIIKPNWQVEYNQPIVGKVNGSKVDELISSIITFTEKRVSKDYLFKLMLDLTYFLILKGELKLAAKISENLISDLCSNRKYYFLEAKAYLALAEIAWNLEYREQSEKYLEKSYEIYHQYENSDSELVFDSCSQSEKEVEFMDSDDEMNSRVSYYSLIKAKSYIDELLGAQSN